jgi:hypothetical protein
LLLRSGEGLAATLSFLMQLSFRRVWQPYPLTCLTSQERGIAGHMAQLGLVATCSQVPSWGPSGVLAQAGKLPTP